MRIRLVPRRDGNIQLFAEQQVRKGKKVTSGRIVPRDALRAETRRLLDEVRGNPPEQPF